VSSIQMLVPERLSIRVGASSVTLLAYLIAVGCVRRDGCNSDCKWPTEVASHSPDAQHLSADAEFAEDLAIRYADVHHGLRTPGYVSGETYAAARDQCMQRLFEGSQRITAFQLGLSQAHSGATGLTSTRP
jgi:hypothetical protein